MTRFAAVRRFIVLTAVAVLYSGVQAQQQAQLFLSVLDAQGAPLKDLKAEEVVVTADGKDCKVLKVEPFSKPMRLTVMIDNGPITSKDLEGLRAAFKALIQDVPEEIPIELLTTAPQPRWLEKLTADRPKLLQAIDRLNRDTSPGSYFDALVEAAARAEKDKADYFPVFVVLVADSRVDLSFQDFKYDKLQKQILQRAITVHYILAQAAGAPRSIGPRADVGSAMAQLSGGQFETVSVTDDRPLTKLMPELARQIAKSDRRQTNQFRVTYESPGKVTAGQQVGASLRTTKAGLVPQLSFDGHMPQSKP